MDTALDATLAKFLEDCVNIDRSQIQDEFCRVSADLAFWGERLAVAEGELVACKSRIDQVRSNVDTEVRQALAVRGDKVTESRVEVLIDGSPQVVRAQSDLASATEERVRLRCIVDAISVKSQMLMSLGAYIREEMRGGPSMNA